MDMIKMKCDLTSTICQRSDRASAIFYEQSEEIANCMYESYVQSPDYEEDTKRDFDDELANVFDGLYGEFLAEASCLIQEDDFVYAGLIVCLYKKVPYITYMFTRPTFQNQGLSRELLFHSCYQLKKMGYQEIYLYLNLENTPAYNLYDTFGFNEVE